MSITSESYETCKLKIPEIRERFSIKLRNIFSALPDEQDVGNHRVKSKSIYNETGTKIIGPRKKKQEWISAKSWKLVEERKTLKYKIDGTRSKRVKEKLLQHYRTKNKEVIKNMGKDNNHWIENLATKAKTEASKGNMKGVYDITKQEAH